MVGRSDLKLKRKRVDLSYTTWRTENPTIAKNCPYSTCTNLVLASYFLLQFPVFVNHFLHSPFDPRLFFFWNSLHNLKAKLLDLFQVFLNCGQFIFVWLQREKNIVIGPSSPDNNYYELCLTTWQLWKQSKTSQHTERPIDGKDLPS